MTSSHAKKKQKQKQQQQTQRGCEMNQLEMTVDESLQSKHWRPSVFSSNQKVSSQP